MESLLNSMSFRGHEQQPVIEVNGEKGVWINKHESDNWNGEIPLSEYKVNVDRNPQIIQKKAETELNYNQEIGIRYLKPPTPFGGEIIINELPAENEEQGPPVIIRQIPSANKSNTAPKIYRETPPEAPRRVDPLIVKIPGKKLPPPPRKMIIEILPKIPKPQPILLERWLTPKPVKRRVIFEKANVVEATNQNAKPEVIINKKYYYIDSKDVDLDKISKEKKSKSAAYPRSDPTRFKKGRRSLEPINNKFDSEFQKFSNSIFV